MGGVTGHLQINGATIVAYRSTSGSGGGPGGGGGMALLDSPTFLNGQKRLTPSTTISAGSKYCIKNSSSNPVMIYQHQSVSGSGFQTSTTGLGTRASGSFIFTSPEVTSGKCGDI